MTMIPITCKHCGGQLAMGDDSLGTTTCFNCGCVWQIRNVLYIKGPSCDTEEPVHDDDEVEDQSPEERLQRL